jgi:alkylation response protein AidB-like acyl-CoA dehydrogenase
MNVPMHIAGDPSTLTAEQRDRVDLAARLGREGFAPRAAMHDREASFPAANFAELREHGLLGLCIPRQCGGLGADLYSYALISAELGRHCGATALSFNMHVSACLWSGLVADALPMSDEQRREHEALRAAQWAGIVQRGELWALPISEGGAASAGRAAFDTRARAVDGGYVVNGRKVFVSMAGQADVYALLCTREAPGAGPRDALFLAVPAAAPGLTVSGEWDPLGMRGTISRTLQLDEVFVPASARLLPEGLYHQAASRFPHMFGTSAPTYLGLAQAACDFTTAYLRGEVPGMAPVLRRMYATKQASVAQMRVLLEQARAMLWQSCREARIDPDRDARLRLYAAHVTVMEHAQAIAALAIRTCGGQSLLKGLPLERIYRDARCGSLMLPWTAELCLERLGHECLYDADEGDEAIE